MTIHKCEICGILTTNDSLCNIAINVIPITCPCCMVNTTYDTGIGICHVCCKELKIAYIE